MRKYYNLEIGQIKESRSGGQYEIVEIIDCKNVRIKAVDKDYERVTSAYNAENGIVRIPVYAVGDMLTDVKGESCLIVGREGSKYIVEWEDGYRRSMQSSAFTCNRVMREEDSSRVNPKVQVGRTFKNFQGCEYTVIEKVKDSAWVVKFKVCGYEVVAERSNIVSGSIHYPFTPTVANVGIIGLYPVDVKSKEYIAWAGMLKRCYSPANESSKIIYEGVTVCDEWKIYENFHKWAISQKFERGWHLDKDLLVKNNKVYSPNTCVFLPIELNSFLTDRRNHRGLYPLGVTYRKSVGNYQASCSTYGRMEYIGVYPTPESAFAAYKARKEQLAKELACKYSGKVDDRAIQALLNFSVEITD